MPSKDHIQQLQKLFAHFKRHGGRNIPDGVSQIELVDDDDLTRWFVQLTYKDENSEDFYISLELVFSEDGDAVDPLDQFSPEKTQPSASSGVRAAATHLPAATSITTAVAVHGVPPSDVPVGQSGSPATFSSAPQESKEDTDVKAQAVDSTGAPVSSSSQQQSEAEKLGGREEEEATNAPSSSSPSSSPPSAPAASSCHDSESKATKTPMSVREERGEGAAALKKFTTAAITTATTTTTSSAKNVQRRTARMPLVFIVAPRLIAAFIHHGALCSLELMSQYWEPTADNLTLLLLALHETLNPFSGDGRVSVDDAERTEGRRAAVVAAGGVVRANNNSNNNTSAPSFSTPGAYSAAEHELGMDYIRRAHPHLFRRHVGPTPPAPPSANENDVRMTSVFYTADGSSGERDSDAVQSTHTGARERQVNAEGGEENLTGDGDAPRAAVSNTHAVARKSDATSTTAADSTAATTLGDRSYGAPYVLRDVTHLNTAVYDALERAYSNNEKASSGSTCQGTSYPRERVLLDTAAILEDAASGSPTTSSANAFKKTTTNVDAHNSTGDEQQQQQRSESLSANAKPNVPPSALSASTASTAAAAGTTTRANGAGGASSAANVVCTPALHAERVLRARPPPAAHLAYAPTHSLLTQKYPHVTKHAQTLSKNEASVRGGDVCRKACSPTTAAHDGDDDGRYPVVQRVVELWIPRALPQLPATTTGATGNSSVTAPAVSEAVAEPHLSHDDENRNDHHNHTRNNRSSSSAQPVNTTQGAAEPSQAVRLTEDGAASNREALCTLDVCITGGQTRLPSANIHDAPSHEKPQQQQPQESEVDGMTRMPEDADGVAVRRSPIACVLRNIRVSTCAARTSTSAPPVDHSNTTFTTAEGSTQRQGNEAEEHASASAAITGETKSSREKTSQAAAPSFRFSLQPSTAPSPSGEVHICEIPAGLSLRFEHMYLYGHLRVLGALTLHHCVFVGSITAEECASVQVTHSELALMPDDRLLRRAVPSITSAAAFLLRRESHRRPARDGKAVAKTKTTNEQRATDASAPAPPPPQEEAPPPPPPPPALFYAQRKECVLILDSSRVDITDDSHLYRLMPEMQHVQPWPPRRRRMPSAQKAVGAAQSNSTDEDQHHDGNVKNSDNEEVVKDVQEGEDNNDSYESEDGEEGSAVAAAHLPPPPPPPLAAMMTVLRSLLLVSNQGRLRLVRCTIHPGRNTERTIFAEQDAIVDMAYCHVTAAISSAVIIQGCRAFLEHCTFEGSGPAASTADSSEHHKNELSPRESNNNDTNEVKKSNKQRSPRQVHAHPPMRLGDAARSTGLIVELGGTLTARFCTAQHVYFAFCVIAHSVAHLYRCHAENVVNGYTVDASAATLDSCSANTNHVGVFVLRKAKCILTEDHQTSFAQRCAWLGLAHRAARRAVAQEHYTQGADGGINKTSEDFANREEGSRARVSAASTVAARATRIAALARRNYARYVRHPATAPKEENDNAEGSDGVHTTALNNSSNHKKNNNNYTTNQPAAMPQHSLQKLHDCVTGSVHEPRVREDREAENAEGEEGEVSEDYPPDHAPHFGICGGSFSLEVRDSSLKATGVTLFNARDTAMYAVDDSTIELEGCVLWSTLEMEDAALRAAEAENALSAAAVADGPAGGENTPQLKSRRQQQLERHANSQNMNNNNNSGAGGSALAKGAAAGNKNDAQTSSLSQSGAAAAAAATVANTSRPPASTPTAATGPRLTSCGMKTIRSRLTARRCFLTGFSFGVGLIQSSTAELVECMAAHGMNGFTVDHSTCTLRDCGADTSHVGVFVLSNATVEAEGVPHLVGVSSSQRVRPRRICGGLPAVYCGNAYGVECKSSEMRCNGVTVLRGRDSGFNIYNKSRVTMTKCLVDVSETDAAGYVFGQSKARGKHARSSSTDSTSSNSRRRSSPQRSSDGATRGGVGAPHTDKHQKQREERASKTDRSLTFTDNWLSQLTLHVLPEELDDALQGGHSAGNDTHSHKANGPGRSGSRNSSSSDCTGRPSAHHSRSHSSGASSVSESGDGEEHSATSAAMRTTTAAAAAASVLPAKKGVTHPSSRHETHSTSKTATAAAADADTSSANNSAAVILAETPPPPAAAAAAPAPLTSGVKVWSGSRCVAQDSEVRCVTFGFAALGPETYLEAHHCTAKHVVNGFTADGGAMQLTKCSASSNHVGVYVLSHGRCVVRRGSYTAKKYGIECRSGVLSFQGHVKIYGFSRIGLYLYAGAHCEADDDSVLDIHAQKQTQHQPQQEEQRRMGQAGKDAACLQAPPHVDIPTTEKDASHPCSAVDNKKTETCNSHARLSGLEEAANVSDLLPACIALDEATAHLPQAVVGGGARCGVTCADGATGFIGQCIVHDCSLVGVNVFSGAHLTLMNCQLDCPRRYAVVVHVGGVCRISRQRAVHDKIVAQQKGDAGTDWAVRGDNTNEWGSSNEEEATESDSDAGREHHESRGTRRNSAATTAGNRLSDHRGGASSLISATRSSRIADATSRLWSAVQRTTRHVLAPSSLSQLLRPRRWGWWRSTTMAHEGTTLTSAALADLRRSSADPSDMHSNNNSDVNRDADMDAFMERQCRQHAQQRRTTEGYVARTRAALTPGAARQRFLFASSAAATTRSASRLGREGGATTLALLHAAMAEFTAAAACRDGEMVSGSPQEKNGDIGEEEVGVGVLSEDGYAQLGLSRTAERRHRRWLTLDVHRQPLFFQLNPLMGNGAAANGSSGESPLFNCSTTTTQVESTASGNAVPAAAPRDAQTPIASPSDENPGNVKEDPPTSDQRASLPFLSLSGQQQQPHHVSPASSPVMVPPSPYLTTNAAAAAAGGGGPALLFPSVLPAIVGAVVIRGTCTMERLLLRPTAVESEPRVALNPVKEAPETANLKRTVDGGDSRHNGASTSKESSGTAPKIADGCSAEEVSTQAQRDSVPLLQQLANRAPAVHVYQHGVLNLSDCLVDTSLTRCTDDVADSGEKAASTEADDQTKTSADGTHKSTSKNITDARKNEGFVSVVAVLCDGPYARLHCDHVRVMHAAGADGELSSDNLRSAAEGAAGAEDFLLPPADSLPLTAEEKSKQGKAVDDTSRLAHDEVSFPAAAGSKETSTSSVPAPSKNAAVQHHCAGKSSPATATAPLLFVALRNGAQCTMHMVGTALRQWPFRACTPGRKSTLQGTSATGDAAEAGDASFFSSPSFKGQTSEASSSSSLSTSHVPRNAENIPEQHDEVAADVPPVTNSKLVAQRDAAETQILQPAEQHPQQAPHESPFMETNETGGDGGIVVQLFNDSLAEASFTSLANVEATEKSVVRFVHCALEGRTPLLLRLGEKSCARLLSCSVSYAQPSAEAAVHVDATSNLLLFRTAVRQALTCDEGSKLTQVESRVAQAQCQIDSKEACGDAQQ